MSEEPTCEDESFIYPSPSEPTYEEPPRNLSRVASPLQDIEVFLLTLKVGHRYYRGDTSIKKTGEGTSMRYYTDSKNLEYMGNFVCIREYDTRYGPVKIIIFKSGYRENQIEYRGQYGPYFIEASATYKAPPAVPPMKHPPGPEREPG